VRRTEKKEARARIVNQIVRRGQKKRKKQVEAEGKRLSLMGFHKGGGQEGEKSRPLQHEEKNSVH